MDKYIFNEWQPNLILLGVSMGLWVWLVIISVPFITILSGIMLLTFGWSMSYSKRIR